MNSQTSDLFRSQYQPVTLRSETRNQRRSIDELQAIYEKIQRQKGKSEKAIQESSFYIHLLRELTGAKYLDELDYESVLAFKNLLSVYPKNKKKLPVFNDVTGYDAIVLCNKLGKETLSPARCLKIVQGLSSFMKFGELMGQAEKNLFSGLMTKSEVKCHKRHQFLNEHLSAIFKMDDYKKHKYRHPYYFWLPLLLRYSGARLNELAGLFTENIANIDNIPCLIINDEFDGQRKKNTNSMRVIPLHSELIRVGFLDFVASQKTGPLFPELKPINGYYSHNASKWFARRRDKLGFGRGFDCYSFRHRFITELRGKDISFPTIMSIAGHVTNREEERLGAWQKSATNQAYSHSLPPSITLPAVESIDSSYTKHLQPYSTR